ncbi:unnamed protein product [Schistosoma mattheei]|uniref:Uncharacterized protein n=1 Tax=Schistosoma mattheei TaxID=31246 RepID=A0A183P581_9TREM|nr:unnamed protein product [Schistosoma mattheei]
MRQNLSIEKLGIPVPRHSRIYEGTPEKFTSPEQITCQLTIDFPIESSSVRRLFQQKVGSTGRPSLPGLTRAIKPLVLSKLKLKLTDSKHANQGVAVNNTLYISGQLGLDPNTMLFAGDDVESQTHQSLKNIREVVQSAGFTMRDVVKTTLLLADMNDFGKVNTIYAQYPYPARATYQVECLPKVCCLFN